MGSADILFSVVCETVLARLRFSQTSATPSPADVAHSADVAPSDGCW
jgi:hypothetical protein